ncbi:hypothetical protein [Xanthomonas bundabergensis]|uniref:hypothetical protein n=1 Tax=Xanthomonas bundabergensis TaxID=3160842 RepID=UPI0035161ECF
MRALAGMLLATTMALAGCASIPLSTALSLASLSPRMLAQTDPAQVRVRLSVPEGYEVDVPAARLTLRLEGASGNKSASMGLSLLGTSRETRSGGLFRSDVPVSTYVLALNPEGVRQLKELQRFVLAGDPSTFLFGVKAPFAKMPPQAREMTFWADLKLSLAEPYKPLIDGARLRFEDTPPGG